MLVCGLIEFVLDMVRFCGMIICMFWILYEWSIGVLGVRILSLGVMLCDIGLVCI